MLTKKQEKLIRSLSTVKGRQESGLCLVEGRKNIEMASRHILYTFTDKDTKNFKSLVTTKTPQNIAGVAKIPEWCVEDIAKFSLVVLLDGVQDPGNVGTIFRLCLGFDASVVLVESADPASPKVIRSSAGTMFHVPYIKINRRQAEEFLQDLNRKIYRLEKTEGSLICNFDTMKAISKDKIVLIAGSEGSGIMIDVKGESISILHSPKLESLNVSVALGIFMNFYYLYRQS